MPRKTPDTRNLTARWRRATFGHVGKRGGKVQRPKSSKTRRVLLLVRVRGTFKKLLGWDVVDLKFSVSMNGQLSLNDITTNRENFRTEAAKAAAKKKAAPAPKRKPTTSRREAASIIEQNHTPHVHWQGTKKSCTAIPGT